MNETTKSTKLLGRRLDNSGGTLADLVEKDPMVTSRLSDSSLVGLFEDRIPAAYQALAAELWLRRWLYSGGCPRSIDQAIEAALSKRLAGFSGEFHDRFKTGLMLLRLNDDGALLPGAGSLGPEETRIWGLLKSRVQSYLEADGLIALIPPTAKDQDAVAIPFRFCTGKAGICIDAKGNELDAWSEVVDELGDLGPSAGNQMIRIEAVFPIHAPPAGVSLGLPIALAWARNRAQNFPLFSPLAILASGEISGNKVFAVRGTGGEAKTDTQGGAKGQLARRLGSKLYVAIDVAAGLGGEIGPVVCSYSSGTKWDEVHSELSRAITELKIKDNLRHLARVEQEESRPASGEGLPPAELWSRWRRLERVKEAFPAPDQRYTKATTGQRRIEVDLGFHDVGTIAAASDQVVSDYHRRRFVGRNDERDRLKDFLIHSSGGAIAVLGPPGYGKSALMAQIASQLPSDRATLVHFFRQGRERTRSVTGFVRRLWHLLLSESGAGEGLPGQMPSDELIGRVDIAWQDWAESPTRRPLVLVIDGLDEARDFFEPPWPSGLPDKVHVIIACRTGINFEPPPIWRSWFSGANVVPLGGLKPAELVDWLGDLPESALTKLPNLQQLAREIEQRTLGCALFAQYLIDDLRRGIEAGQSWENVMAHTPTGFADYLYRQYVEFDGPGTNRARQLIALLVAAYGPLYLGEIQRILPDLEPGYAFTDLPWQAYRWVTRETGREDWGEQFSLTHDVLREALTNVVVQTNAKEHLLAFCQDYKKHLSPYAVRYVARYNVECFSPADNVASPRGQVALSAPSPAKPTKWAEAPTEPSIIPPLSEAQTDKEETVTEKDESKHETRATLPDPIPELAKTARCPVESLSGLEVLNRDSAFIEACSVELQDEPAPVLNEVRRALEQAVQETKTNYRRIIELALTHARLVHQLAEQDRHACEASTSALKIAEHFLKLPVQWDPAAQVMWRLVAAWEHHRAKRITERDRHLKALGNTFDVRLPAAWAFLVGALLVELFPSWHPLLRTFARRFLGVEATAEMVGRLIWQGADGVRAARQWLKWGSRYETSILRRHVVHNLAKVGRWREADLEARAGFTVKEQSTLILHLAELAEKDLNRTKDLWRWLDYLRPYVQYAQLPTGDFLRVNTALGRIVATLARHELLLGRDNVDGLVKRAESFVRGKGFIRGSGVFDVQVALALAFGSVAARKKNQQKQHRFRILARQHRRKAFHAWLHLRATSGDTLEVFQIWLWFAHLTFSLVKEGVLPERIGRLWENRIRRILISTDDNGEARIHSLLNGYRMMSSTPIDQVNVSTHSLRYLEPVEWDSAMVAAVEAVLEAPSFTPEEILHVISRSRSTDARGRGMARWIRKLMEDGQPEIAVSSLAQSQLRAEDIAGAHSLIARRMLGNGEFERASGHLVASIEQNTEKVEGSESVQRVELLAALSRAAGVEGDVFFEEACHLVNNYPNSKPVEKSLLCSSLAKTAIHHRRHSALITTQRRRPEHRSGIDKGGWTKAANYWFEKISKLQECPGTGYQRRARKVMILCEKAKHLYRLNWAPEDQKRTLRRAQVFAQNEPSMQRRCELICQAAEACVSCGEASTARELLADMQAELPVLSTMNPDSYLWRKPGIKPRMLRGSCLAELVLALGKASIQSWQYSQAANPPVEASQVWSQWKLDKSLTSKQRVKIEEIEMAFHRNDPVSALCAASQVNGDPSSIAELRSALMREVSLHLDWSVWALAYADDPDIQFHQSALRGLALASAARDVWSQTWKFVRRISDPVTCANTFCDLAEFSARTGSPYDVRQRAKNLMSSQDKDRFLHRIVAALVERYQTGLSSDHQRAAIRKVLLELVPPCADSFSTTYLMLARLVEIEPHHWRTAANILRSRDLIRPSEQIRIE